MSILPQYGFTGGEVEFKSLVDKNPFLFRVHTPKASSNGSGFMALKFNGRFTSAAPTPTPDLLHPPIPTYADVVGYMDWTTRHSSAYVSASFSLMWSLWEALRRYHSGVKHDVEIAIIDATALNGAVTVVEVMRAVSPNERHENHWKWYHFAEESQTVLVYGCIPPTAILASIPVLRILDALPSYCLVSPSSLSSSYTSPVHRILPWTHITSTHPHYRRFCNSLSESFLRLSHEERWIESTHGAVQLAFAFLGRWFEWMYHFDLEVPHELEGEGGDQDQDIFRAAARTKLSELAQAIALWPAPLGLHHDKKLEWGWDDVVREIALLVAVHGAPFEHGGKRKHQRGRRQSARYSVAFSDVASLSEFSGFGVGGGDSEPEPEPECPCEKKELVEGDADGIPVVLDPRNYLPTPPPTPPPFLVGEEDEEGWVEVEKPGFGLAEPAVVEAGALPSLPLSIPSAEVPPPDPVDDLGELEDNGKSSPSATARPSSAPAPASSQPRKKCTPAPVLLSSETASCLFAGFLIGALLVVVLAQRRVGVVHLS
ncbi:hypothetical protein FB45DRAFT_48026 [Roridomyces roridus]|uniref:DUF7587 domain-containing protein n=1 Tax=Roridomyces roridus TaxID=1738132 RepID=A0AAD7BT70_9AGAR|nr:hypothetical protein FB45DRAFT_48026 [Roridomyces roridus]